MISTWGQLKLPFSGDGRSKTSVIITKFKRIGGMDTGRKEAAQAVETSREHGQESLGSTVKTALNLYFKNLGGHRPGSIYQMVMAEVERPMLEAVMDYAKGNQCHASQILGISRSTLRKKLKLYEPD